QFRPKNEKSLMLRTHCQTSGWSLTEQDPFNNVARTTIEAAAAVFGGTQSLHTNALDEAIALPTDFSARIARNTQLFLREETKITKTVDPWGGSYFVEGLTHNLAQNAWELIQEIEELGGMTKAIETGIPKMRIEAAAAKKQARIDSGQDCIIGLNKYRSADEDHLQILAVNNAEVRKQQLERLRSVKNKRDSNKVTETLLKLTEAARSKKISGEKGWDSRLHGKKTLEQKETDSRLHGSNNLLTLAIEAARARATLGEISNALETVFGRHRAETKTITGVYSKEIQGNEAFKKARELTDRFAEQEGRRPR